jgi:type IV pilus assembly protein PilQ
VTIDVTNAPLERVLTDIVRQLNSDLVIYNQLSGNVTVRASYVALPRALDMILRNTNFTFRESGGVYFVGEKANKALISTSLLKLKHLRADQVLELIPASITSQSTIKVMKEHNGFVVIGPNDAVEQLREFLFQIDKPVAQVLIEAIVVDYDLSKASEFGVEAGVLGKSDTVAASRKGMYIPGFDMQWGGNDLNLYLAKAGKVNVFGTTVDFASIGKLPADFYLNLKAMEKDGLANVKSRPIISTLNGHKAMLSIGTTQYFLLKTTIPYRDQNQVLFQESESFQTIEADVRLEITPYVGADGLITLDIKPDFKTPIGQLSPEIPPTINSRSLSSTVVVKEGETIVLGGLVQEYESEVKTRVPILGSIPLLGKLFSSTTTSNRKAELLIYVTPRISYGEGFQQSFREPEGQD